jgi:hypothetical protein
LLAVTDWQVRSMTNATNKKAGNAAMFDSFDYGYYFYGYFP